MSALTPSSPRSWSAHLPSTAASPSSSRPSSTKNATAAARSSTTTPTWSIRWIIVPPRVTGWPVVGRSCPWDVVGATFSTHARCDGRHSGYCEESAGDRGHDNAAALRAAALVPLYAVNRYEVPTDHRSPGNSPARRLLRSPGRAIVVVLEPGHTVSLSS